MQPIEQINVKELLEKATNYSKVVLGLGYAGFFAAWSTMKQQLSPRRMMLSALLLTVSLFAYILYEVVSNIFLNYALVRYLPMSRRMKWSWFGAVLISFTTGFAGAIVLMWSFASGLFGH